MEKIPKTSSLNLPPTPKQRIRIAKFASALHIQEPVEEYPKNRVEARNLIYKMRSQLKGGTNEKT